MGKTKNNHYLSQHISKNFRVIEHQPFWEYDCSAQIGPKQRSVERLFAGRKLWSQQMEDTIGHAFENDLARELKWLANCPVEKARRITDKVIVEAQFNGFIIEKEELRRLLDKLLLQTMFLQHYNAREKDNNAEDWVIRSLTNDMNFNVNVMLVEINPLMTSPPLILIDGMTFMVFIPERNNKENLGHICFFFPISTKRFLFWGNEQDFLFFANKYQNIDFLNLSRIQQHRKKCKIATQDIIYLNSLISRIPIFKSNEQVDISIERYWE